MAIMESVMAKTFADLSKTYDDLEGYIK